MNSLDMRMKGVVPPLASRHVHSFQTTRDGHIPLDQEWRRVLERMRWLSGFFVQVDHAHARMSMFLKRKDYDRSLSNALRYNGLIVASDYDGWANAHARITTCQCCGSQGNLNFKNQFGSTFMQMTPSSETSLIEWATLVDGITSKMSMPMSLMAPARGFLRGHVRAHGGIDLELCGQAFAALLDELATQSIPLEFTICAAEVNLRQSYVIDGLRESNGVLECMGKRASFSLYLPAIATVHAMFEEGRMTLLLVDQADRVLFRVRAKLGAGVDDVFQRVIGL
ncbi:hypothetical protein [Lentimonas sp. CC4]|nr:hypothetical protein [Lentimonas sp. CC4]